MSKFKLASIRFLVLMFALHFLLGFPLPAQAKPKVGKHLEELFQDHQASQQGISKKKQKRKGKLTSGVESLVRTSNGYVVIDAIAVDDPEGLKAELEGLGLIQAAVSGRVVSGLFPISGIDKMPQCLHLNFAKASLAITNVGRVTSQGDAAMKANIARATHGVDGNGVTVGVLSDSYNCRNGANRDVNSGDLPAGVNVLQELAPCSGTDEGRAMMQIIHDVAPGAPLAFHTAFGGIANFANGIRDLAAAGAKVIVDDVIYFAEPMFQDGPIAQAVDEVSSAGAAYFSSAGNQARKSYESDFRNGGTLTVNGQDVVAHDFDSGGGVDILQQVTIPGRGGLLVSLQWDSPAASAGGAGSPNDVDLHFTDQNGNILFSSANSNIGGDPVEILSLNNNGGAPFSGNLLIVHAGGPAPGKIKYVRFRNSTIGEFRTNSPTTYGHANAAGGEAVGAAYWGTPDQLESFSSAGGTPILFDTAGNRLQTPDTTRIKPGVVGPDGVSTTFFGSRDVDGDRFRDFFGTSASAPHVAAVAALMLQANPLLTPAETYTGLESTATDMGPQGFDPDTGFGFVQADAAVDGVVGPPVCNLQASTVDLDFGTKLIGTTQTLPLTLSNVGRASCTITGLGLTAGSGFTLPNPPTLPVNLGPQTALDLSVDFTPAGLGAHSDTLTITSTGNPVILVRLSGTGTNVANADLAVSTTDSPDPVIVGENVTYTVTVTNNGPDRAADVTMTDTLSAGTIVSVTGPGCQPISNPVSCGVGLLAAGGSVSWNIVVEAPTAPIVMTSTATATLSSPQNDPVPENNIALQETQVVPIPEPCNLQFASLPLDFGPQTVGRTLSKPFLLTNQSPDSPCNVRLSLPAVETNFSLTPPSPASFNLNPLSEFSVPVNFTPAGVGDITSTLTVTNNSASPPNSTPVTLTGTGVPDQDADVGITIAASPSPLPLGQPLVYTIVVTNHGGGVATGVKVTDILPSPPPVGTLPIECSSSFPGRSRIVKCDLGTIAPGDGNARTLVIGTTPTRVGTASSSVRVVANESDPNTRNNSAIVRTAVQAPGAVCDLDVTPLSLNFPDVRAGSTRSKFVTLNNRGNGTCAVSLSKTGSGDFDFRSTRGNPFDLGSGRSSSVPVSYTPSGSGADSGEFIVASNDPNKGTITVRLSGNSLAPPPVTDVDLGVALDVQPDPGTVGQPLTYTVTVTSLTGGPATGVRLRSSLSRLKNVSVNGPGTCTVRNDRSVTCDLPDLAPGGQTIVTIVATPKKSGNVFHTTRVSSRERDVNLGNNSVTRKTRANKPVNGDDD